MEKLFDEKDQIVEKSQFELKKFLALHKISLGLLFLSLILFVITMITVSVPISKATYKAKYLSDYMIIEEELRFSAGGNLSVLSKVYSTDSDEVNANQDAGKYEIKKGVLIINQMPFGVCNAFAIKTKKEIYYCYSKIWETMFCVLAFLGCLIIGILLFRAEKDTSCKKRISRLEKEVAELKASKKDDE